MVSKKFLTLFTFLSIFCVVMITPAFAVELDEVAHAAEKYKEESHKKHGFFGKIKFAHVL